MNTHRSYETTERPSARGETRPECDFESVVIVLKSWRWDNAEGGSGKKDCGRRQRALTVSASHPFYQRLNQILDEKRFNEYVEDLCQQLLCRRKWADLGWCRESYFQLLMVGYFEGMIRNAELRGEPATACRSGLSCASPWMKACRITRPLSRTRRLMDVETHQAVFQWVLAVLAEKKLLKGTTIGVDATTLEANAALRSIRAARIPGSVTKSFSRLARESGIETPTREQLNIAS